MGPSPKIRHAWNFVHARRTTGNTKAARKGFLPHLRRGGNRYAAISWSSSVSVSKSAVRRICATRSIFAQCFNTI